MNYKDLENNLHFLDSAEFEHLLPVGCVQITDNEADSIRLSKVVPPTKEELNAPILATLAAADLKIIRSVVEGDTVRIAAHNTAQATLRAKLLK